MVTTKIIDAIVKQADATVVKSLLKRILHEIVESRPWDEPAMNVMLTILSGASTSINIEENVMSCPKIKLVDAFKSKIYCDGKELVSVTPTKVSISDGRVHANYVLKDAEGKEKECNGIFEIPEEFYS